MHTELELDQEMIRVYWACVQCARKSPNPELDQSICFEWVLPIYQEAFDCRFHQSQLRLLAKAGLLCHSDLTRGKKRRYYTIPNLNEAERIVASVRA